MWWGIVCVVGKGGGGREIARWRFLGLEVLFFSVEFGRWCCEKKGKSRGVTSDGSCFLLIGFGVWREGIVTC